MLATAMPVWSVETYTSPRSESTCRLWGRDVTGPWPAYPSVQCGSVTLSLPRSPPAPTVCRYVVLDAEWPLLVATYRSPVRGLAAMASTMWPGSAGRVAFMTIG